MPYKVCVFDLDGTLTDPFTGVANAFIYALKKLGIEEEPDNPKHFIGPPLHESFRNLYNLSDAETDRAVEYFREHYGTTGLYENEVYPGIIELLQSLKDNGVKLAVATSKYGKYANTVLEHFDLLKYFEAVSGDSYDGSLSRGGKQKIIKIALDAINPEKNLPAVVIGDRMHDIEGARNLGIDSIGVAWGYGSHEELTTSGAVHIVNSPDEVKRLILGKH